MYNSMDELVAHVGLNVDEALKKYDGDDVWITAIGKTIGPATGTGSDADVNPLEMLKELIRLGDAQTISFILLDSNRQGQADLYVRMLRDGRNVEKMSTKDHLYLTSLDPKENCDFYAIYYETIKFECWRRGMKVEGYNGPWPSKEEVTETRISS